MSVKDYSTMSNFDIQQEVLQKTWGKHPVRLLGKMMLGITLSEYDPCNKPADAWQIIIENRITIIACADKWIAAPSGTVIDGDTSEDESMMYCNSFRKPHAFADSNPLRAAMIVFLMMKGVEKDNGQ